MKVKADNDVLLRLLERATDPDLLEPNWKINLQIIDRVNTTRKEQRHRECFYILYNFVYVAVVRFLLLSLDDMSDICN